MKKSAIRRADGVGFVAGLPVAKDYVLLAFFSLFLVVLRVAYLTWWTPYGLAPDEAQYWHWLTHLQGSYVTKPPLTTWLMGLGTWLLGGGLVGVKFFAVFGALVAVPLLGFEMGRLLYGRRAAWWSFALFSTVPLVASGGMIMSPDVVLLPLWMGALVAVLRGFSAKNEARALCWGRWILVGILVGLAGLAKYSAALFFPLLGIFLFFERRAWLKAPQIWLSGVVALVMQAPVLMWNYQHAWAGVVHVLWQANGGGDAEHGGVGSLGEFVVSQAGVIGPVVFGMLLVAWFLVVNKWFKNSVLERFLVAMTLPIFVGFLLMTVQGKVQANWALLGVVPPLVLVTGILEKYKHYQKLILGLLVVGIGLNTLLSVGLYDTGLVRAVGVPLKMKNDPTKDMRGWNDMGQILAVLLAKVDHPLVLASRYQTAAQVAYHAGAEVIYMNAEGRRATEYDLWTWPDLSGRIVVYVAENERLPEKVSALFGQCRPWHRVATEQEGQVVRRMWTWVCWDALAATR